jgi:hypothetical protein
LSTAIDLAKTLAKIPREEEVRLVPWPRSVSFFGSIFGRREASPAAAGLPAELRRAYDWAARLDPDRVWAMMPLVPGR